MSKAVRYSPEVRERGMGEVPGGEVPVQSIP